MACALLVPDRFTPGSERNPLLAGRADHHLFHNRFVDFGFGAPFHQEVGPRTAFGVRFLDDETGGSHGLEGYGLGQVTFNELAIRIIIIRPGKSNGLAGIGVAEAENAGQKNFPFIITIIDMGLYWYINELASGEPLLGRRLGCG
jgi:hypothetical protein